MWKEMEGQVITYICSFGARETHDTRLPTSSLRAWGSRAAILTSGTLRMEGTRAEVRAEGERSGGRQGPGGGILTGGPVLPSGPGLPGLPVRP